MRCQRATLASVRVAPRPLAAPRLACDFFAAMPRATAYLLAREPRPGTVKTRLCPPLSPQQASRLAAAFASDALGLLAAVTDVERRLAVAGDAAEAPQKGASAGGILAALAAARGVRLEMQEGATLGDRMADLLARGLALGRPTLLVGADAPDLPATLVEASLAALRDVDVVLIGARDGGYVLVGARRPVPGLFEIDAPWGSDRVLEATCASLGRAGVSHAVAGHWEDVDDGAALRRLAARLDAAGRDATPATAGLIEALRREGVRF
jgi:rSAM/selenodomain-associated transferase 1